MKPSRLLLTAAAIAAGAFACSPGFQDEASQDFDTNDGNGDSDDVDEDPDTDGDTDTAPQEDAVWWSVDGEIVVAASSADPAASRLRVGFWSAGTTLLCETDVVISGVTPLAAPDEVPVYGWWSWALAEGATPCEWPIPAALSLGIGEMDPRLAPALEANGLADRQANLYAMYAAPLGADAVYVFGVAGTAEQYAGTGTPVTLAPLPDGAYELRTLHLLPIEE
jgi:hypothetical protein